MSKESQNLYKVRDPKNFIHDGEPRALYWLPYREKYNELITKLTPTKPIPEDVPVMIVGNNSLNPFHFDLKKKDRFPLFGFDSPGISAHIAFTDNFHIACGAIFDRDCRRQDHLYIIPRSDMFSEINYSVIYLPTPNTPLHVRIVHKTHLENPEIHLPPFEDRTKLAELFTKYKRY